MVDVCLSFQIHYQASFGEVIVLVGDCTEFGNWDVNLGILLKWSQVKITFE